MSAPDSGRPLRIVLSPAARRDIREALQWSRTRFGERAAFRYHSLLRQAIHDIAADPDRPGSRERPDLSSGLRTYHLFFSRGRVGGAAVIVRKPRHLVVYRRRGDTVIDVLRVLHDARELERNLPE